MRITLTLMVVFFTLGCTSTTIQPPIAASTEAMAVEVSPTATANELARLYEFEFSVLNAGLCAAILPTRNLL